MPPARFIVSHADADRDWAEWIGFQITRAGAEAHVEYDAGSNEVVEFQRMVDRGDRVVAVVSKAALADTRCQSRWAAMLAADQDGAARRLMPVIVETCRPGVLLDAVTSVRLVGLRSQEAVDCLLDALGLRVQEVSDPPFPGATDADVRRVDRVDSLMNRLPSAHERRALVRSDDSLPRLRLLSKQVLAEVGQVNVEGRGDFAAGLYVYRDVEPDLLARLRSGATDPQLVVGEPGSGKSSLLWGLATTLLAEGREVFAVKAAWLRKAGGRLVSGGTVARALRATGPRTTLLVDTADLVVHDTEGLVELVTIVDAARAAGASVAVTSRPAEAQLLPGTWTRVRLRDYDAVDRDGGPSEFERAVAAHSVTYCPSVESARTMVARLVEAVARWQPLGVLAVRPLTMRMLFELYAPSEIPPNVDVTGLNQQFWIDRVYRDRRVWSRRPPLASADRDLRPTAMRLALEMLANGTPEVLPLSGSYDPVRAADFLDDVGLLVERGVGEWSDHGGERAFRFFHQTFFEFAAAQALLDGLGADALDLLAERIRARPDDYFTLAVFEQTWLCAWQDAKLATAAASLANKFLDELRHQIEFTIPADGFPFPYPLQRTVLSVLAQSSAISDESKRKLGEVLHVAELPVVRDCLALMPPPMRLWRSDDIDVLARCVARDDVAWVSVIGVLNRLASRDPALAVTAVCGLRLVERLVELPEQDFAIRKELPALLARLLPTEPSLLSELRALCAVANGHGLRGYTLDVMRLVVAQLPALTGVDVAAWADEVVAGAAGPVHATIVVHAEFYRIRTRWLAIGPGGWSGQLVELKTLLGACAMGEASQHDYARFGGMLLAFAHDAPVETAPVVVALLRAVEQPALHGELRRGWLSGYGTRAPNAMIDQWVAWLVAGLPAAHREQHDGSTRWADTVRRIIQSDAVPTQLCASVAETVAARLGPRSWLDRDMLLMVLLRAAVGGAQSAREAIHVISTDPTVLGVAASVLAASPVPDGITDQDLLLWLDLLIAWQRRREVTGVLKQFPAPHGVESSLLALVESGRRSGRPNEESAAALMLETAVERRVLVHPSWPELISWLGSSRSAAVHTALIRLIGTGVDQGRYRWEDARDELTRLCDTSSAARAELVVLLAKWGDESVFAELIDLAFREPVDSSVLARASSYVRKEHRKTTPLEEVVAVDFLLAFGHRLKDTSVRARQDTAVRWRGAIAEVVTDASLERQLDVLAALDHLDEDFTASIVLQLEPWRHPEVQSGLNAIVTLRTGSDRVRRNIRMVLAEKTRHHVHYDWPELRGRLGG